MTIFSPRSDGIPEPQGRGYDVLEHAVDAVADPILLLEGLHVDVARTLPHGVGEDEVHQPDHGGGVGGLLKLLLLQAEGSVILYFQLQAFGLRLVDEAVDAHQLLFVLPVRHVAVMLPDGVFEGRLGGHDGVDVEARPELDFVDGEHVGGVGHCKPHDRPQAADRQHLVPQGHLDGNQPDGFRVHLKAGEVDGSQSILLGQCGHHLAVVQEAQPHEGGPQHHAVGFLVLQGRPELALVDEALLQEDFAKLAVARRALVGHRSAPPAALAPVLGEQL
jgi:hypothetical protein